MLKNRYLNLEDVENMLNELSVYPIDSDRGTEFVISNLQALFDCIIDNQRLHFFRMHWAISEYYHKTKSEEIRNIIVENLGRLGSGSYKVPDSRVDSRTQPQRIIRYLMPSTARSFGSNTLSHMVEYANEHSVLALKEIGMAHSEYSNWVLEGIEESIVPKSLMLDSGRCVDGSYETPPLISKKEFEQWVENEALFNAAINSVQEIAIKHKHTIPKAFKLLKFLAEGRLRYEGIPNREFRFNNSQALLAITNIAKEHPAYGGQSNSFRMQVLVYLLDKLEEDAENPLKQDRINQEVFHELRSLFDCSDWETEIRPICSAYKRRLEKIVKPSIRDVFTGKANFVSLISGPHREYASQLLQLQNIKQFEDLERMQKSFPLLSP